MYIRTEEHKRKLAEGLKPFQFKEEHIPWNKGIPSGNIPWNKGLTAVNNEKVRQHIQGLLNYAQSPEGRAKSIKIANKHLRNLWVNMSEVEKKEFIEKRTLRIRETRSTPQAIEKQRQSLIQAHKRNPKHLEAMRKGLHIKPNRLEKTILKLLDTYYPNEWKFTGDGSFTLERLCPDFVNINGKKQIIEVFGEYWHQEKVKVYNQTEKGRTEAFAKYGYKTLIIWGRELKDIDSVLVKIKGFVENP